MYNGEVHIFQEDLDRFLTIAQRLKLEGLLGDGSESDEQHSTPNETSRYLEERSSEPFYEQMPETATMNQTSSKIIPFSNTETEDVGSMLDDNLEALDEEHSRCIICGKDSTGMTYPEALCFCCQLCGKKFRFKSSYSAHFCKMW